MRKALSCLIVVFVAVLAGCGNQPEEVSEATASIVTRIVEVPAVTIETIEVTRLVEITREVESTRLVVVTATPPPPTPTPTAGPLRPADARASTFVDGNGSPDLPEGEPDRVSVIVMAEPQVRFGNTTIPFIVRNNTADPVRRIAVSAAAYDTENQLLATASDDPLNPNIVAPGEIAMGYLIFSGVELSVDARLETEVTSSPVSTSFENIRDLDIAEVDHIDNRIVGFLHNPYEETVNGPIGVEVFCFDEDNTLLSRHRGFTDQDTAAPDRDVPFAIQILGDAPCPIYLVTGSGFVN